MIEKWKVLYCNSNYEISNLGDIRNKKMSKKISKKIIQYDLDNNFIKEWKSMLEIQRELGIWHSRIGKCCRGITKSVNGYIWKYESEVMLNA